LYGRAVPPAGTLLLHFAMADNGYRTEADWLADGSLAGRAKLRYGSTASPGRRRDDGLAERAGFPPAPVVESLGAGSRSLATTYRSSTLLTAGGDGHPSPGPDRHPHQSLTSVNYFE